MRFISENVLLYFSAFGVVQGIFLALILYYHPKSCKSVTVYLSWYIFFLSFPSIILVGQHIISWHIMIFVQPFLVIIGPLLYLYIRSFTEKINWRKAWPHFILFFILSVTSIIFYTSVGSKYPVSQKVPAEILRHPLYYVPVTIRSLQRLLYYFLCYRVLRSYQKSIEQIFSDISRINLRWVKWLIDGYLVLVLIVIAFNILSIQFTGYYNYWVLFIGLLITVYVYIAAIKGIAQPTLWQIRPELTPEKLELEMQTAAAIEERKETPQQALSANSQMQAAPQEKERIKLEKEKIQEINTRVISLMEKEELYKEAELTLQDLSTKIQHPTYQVSLAINEGLNKSFYDLVNGYRVEEAKRLLLMPDSRNYTILSVGFEAGFNSKTTFNTVFKKFTGLTPTEYKNKIAATV